MGFYKKIYTWKDIGLDDPLIRGSDDKGYGRIYKEEKTKSFNNYTIRNDIDNMYPVDPTGRNNKKTKPGKTKPKRSSKNSNKLHQPEPSSGNSNLFEGNRK